MAMVRETSMMGRTAICALALAGTLLAAGPRAAKAGPQGAELAPVQYYQPNGGGYDRDRSYGRDRFERDRDGDRYGRERYDPRHQESFGRGGGGGAGGSFQRSCTDVRQSGSTLSAVCGDGRGNRYNSTIDLNRCGGQDVANNGGFLRCGNVQGNGGGRAR